MDPFSAITGAVPSTAAIAALVPGAPRAAAPLTAPNLLDETA